MELRAGETLLRTDLVQLWRLPEGRLVTIPKPYSDCVTHMTLTSERLIFEPPRLSWVETAYLLLRFYLYHRSSYHRLWTSLPLGHAAEINLADIQGFETWRPRFSFAFLIRMGPERFEGGFMVQLLNLTSTPAKQRWADTEEEA